MLRLVPRVWLAAILLGGALTSASWQSLRADETAPNTQKGDNFFSGNVRENTAEKITIARTVLGKLETRSFIVTPDTKVEGRLRLKVRVTVRYITDDNGDTATMIVVRGANKKK